MFWFHLIYFMWQENKKLNNVNTKEEVHVTCVFFFFERRREKGEGEKKDSLIHLFNQPPPAPLFK